MIVTMLLRKHRAARRARIEWALVGECPEQGGGDDSEADLHGVADSPLGEWYALAERDVRASRLSAAGTRKGLPCMKCECGWISLPRDSNKIDELSSGEEQSIH